MAINHVKEFCLKKIEEMNNEDELIKLINELWAFEQSYYVDNNNPEEGETWDLFWNMLRSAQKRYLQVIGSTTAIFDYEG